MCRITEKKLDADRGISSRGVRALTPCRDDLPQFFNAMADPYDPVSNPNGYLSLLVAENKLNWPMMKAKLQEESCGKVDDWTAGYDDFRGNQEFRCALATMMQDTFIQVFVLHMRSDLMLLYPAPTCASDTSCPTTLSLAGRRLLLPRFVPYQ